MTPQNFLRFIFFPILPFPHTIRLQHAPRCLDIVWRNRFGLQQLQHRHRTVVATILNDPHNLKARPSWNP